MGRPKWNNEHWSRAKAIYDAQGGRDGALAIAAEQSGIPYGTLKQVASAQQWATGNAATVAVEQKIGGNIIGDLSTVIRDWMSEMVNGIGRSLQIFKDMDAKGTPADWPTIRMREDTIKLHQDRVRSLLGLDQQSAADSRQISADWKPAKIIEVSTDVELGGEIKNPPPQV